VSTPALHLVVGPNGAGKTTFYEEVLGPATHLPWINADAIALEHWPDDPAIHAYDAARAASDLRRDAIQARRSFATETVFSHPSKLELLDQARAVGYLTHLHVILIPEELAVERVRIRVETGGHDVPAEKIRQRYRRLWKLVRSAISSAHRADVRDNSRGNPPFRLVARFLDGELVGQAVWPPWTPPALKARASNTSTPGAPESNR